MYVLVLIILIIEYKGNNNWFYQIIKSCFFLNKYINSGTKSRYCENCLSLRKQKKTAVWLSFFILS